MQKHLRLPTVIRIITMSAKEKKKLREGITTGTCAAAAAAAAVEAFFDNSPQTVSVDLPDNHGTVSVEVHSAEIVHVQDKTKIITATVVKDAGDDPDITHGVQIGAQVSIVENGISRITIKGGPGVGRVTRPGLPVPAGEWAINPVPRKMIEQEVRRRLPANKGFSAKVIIFVKDGEKLSQKTLNPRLGIVGGISILGTSGIVKPFSAKSYRETIDICLRSARANGQKTCVLSTGRRSERLAQALYPDIDERCFVQIADFFSHALKQSADLGFEHIVLSGFFGKLCKWAMNMAYTHAKSGLIDFGYLSQLAAESGLSGEFCRFIKEANNARHIFQSGCPGVSLFIEAVGQKALHNARDIIDHKANITICLWDFNEDFYQKWEV
jgi:cobalt-precorrin-5B (C1)-methyltransferase